MRHTGRGRYKTNVNLLDTPLEREGNVKVIFNVYGWYFPMTYWEPEDSGQEVEDITIEGLGEGDAQVLEEFLMDNVDNYVDWSDIDWQN